MSEDERTKKRKEHEDDEAEVEAHIYEDDPGDVDPDKKRQQKRHDDFGSGEPERKKK
jgi:hypothetical protein